MRLPVPLEACLTCHRKLCQRKHEPRPTRILISSPCHRVAGGSSTYMATCHEFKKFKLF